MLRLCTYQPSLSGRHFSDQSQGYSETKSVSWRGDWYDSFVQKYLQHNVLSNYVSRLLVVAFIWFSFAAEIAISGGLSIPQLLTTVDAQVLTPRRVPNFEEPKV